MSRAGATVEVGHSPGAVALGVVDRHTSVVDHRAVEVVDSGDRATDLPSQAGPGRNRGKVQGGPGQGGIHRRASLGDRREALGDGHLEGQPPSQDAEQGDGGI